MMKSVLMLVIVLFFSNIIILDSYQTHVSSPIITSDKIDYKQGENIMISGWVSYNDEPTSDVLLRIIATDPKEVKIFDEYTTSTIDGEFSIKIPIATNAEIGNYSIQVISQCREIHREVCTHQYESLSIDIERKSDQKIPDWVKNNVEWWADGIIADQEFVRGIEFLINEGILIVPPTVIVDEQSDKIPDWIKNNGKWWTQGIISDDEFLNNIQYLIANGILSVSSEISEPELQIISGNFSDADFIHRASGTASIEFITNEGGTLYFDQSFDTTNGPDLYVYLATDKSGKDYVNVGQLQSFKGEQSYSVSSDVDLEKYDNVLIWCQAFGVLFGNAELK